MKGLTVRLYKTFKVLSLAGVLLLSSRTALADSKILIDNILSNFDRLVNASSQQDPEIFRSVARHAKAFIVMRLSQSDVSEACLEGISKVFSNTNIREPEPEKLISKLVSVGSIDLLHSVWLTVNSHAANDIMLPVGLAHELEHLIQKFKAINKVRNPNLISALLDKLHNYLDPLTAYEHPAFDVEYAIAAEMVQNDPLLIDQIRTRAQSMTAEEKKVAEGIKYAGELTEASRESLYKHHYAEMDYLLSVVTRSTLQSYRYLRLESYSKLRGYLYHPLQASKDFRSRICLFVMGGQLE